MKCLVDSIALLRAPTSLGAEGALNQGPFQRVLGAVVPFF